MGWLHLRQIHWVCSGSVPAQMWARRWVQLARVFIHARLPRRAAGLDMVRVFHRLLWGSRVRVGQCVELGPPEFFLVVTFSSSSSGGHGVTPFLADFDPLSLGMGVICDR
ncbi:MAG: hypothetical protein CVT66_06215 [Actinobacteria bacterium HGW-Actinobacteria-6]|nr:MAG: hypothetical protein CVT66_06215 [Actinobacteria bacterium HGW-Actinobacteria-6]